jgi:hypothetical protein
MTSSATIEAEASLRHVNQTAGDAHDRLQVYWELLWHLCSTHPEAVIDAIGAKYRGEVMGR